MKTYNAREILEEKVESGIIPQFPIEMQRSIVIALNDRFVGRNTRAKKLKLLRLLRDNTKEYFSMFPTDARQYLMAPREGASPYEVLMAQTKVIKFLSNNSVSIYNEALKKLYQGKNRDFEHKGRIND